MSQCYDMKGIQLADDYISKFLDLVFKGPERCRRTIHPYCCRCHKWTPSRVHQCALFSSLYRQSEFAIATARLTGCSPGALI
jgi:hypothetical protein